MRAAQRKVHDRCIVLWRNKLLRYGRNDYMKKRVLNSFRN
jgi:hypothetical protein